MVDGGPEESTGISQFLKWRGRGLDIIPGGRMSGSTEQGGAADLSISRTVTAGEHTRRADSRAKPKLGNLSHGPPCTVLQERRGFKNSLEPWLGGH